MAHVSKKESKGKGWLMRQKEEHIWDRRGAEREHGTRSTARLLIFLAFNHPFFFFDNVDSKASAGSQRWPQRGVNSVMTAHARTGARRARAGACGAGFYTDRA
jgi:hypothetical protein